MIRQVGGLACARQHPRNRVGTGFFTIEVEESDAQIVLRGQVFACYRRAVDSRLLLVVGTTTRPTSLPSTLRLPPRAVSCLRPTTGPERHYAFDWIILELLSGGAYRSTHRSYIVSSLLSVPPPLVFSDRLTGSNGEVCHDKR